MPLNKKRKYSNIKHFNDCCATALHEAKDVWVESLGATVRCGGERDFIKMDRKGLANRQIDKNRRKLDKFAKNAEVEGLVSRLLGRITALKSPEEPSRPDG